MSEKEIKVLIFKINEEYYATNIMEVERILGYEKTTKLPDSPDFVDGVINYEGGILPVILIAKKFNIPLKKLTEESKVIVVKQGNSKVGMIVDLVSEVKDVNPENIETPPEIVTGISKRYIKGLIKIEGKIVIFLNLSTILTEDEKSLLNL